MPRVLKRILIFVFSVVFAIGGAFFLHSVLAQPLVHVMSSVFALVPWKFAGALFLDVFKLLLLEPFQTTTALIIGAAIGCLYGIEAGLLLIYDLDSPLGWLALFIDMTWSLPNTAFGLIFGNLIYLFFGSPSGTDSENKGWIVYSPSGTSGLGVDVLQTLGTVNIGGDGKHERVHLLQARLFGPFFLLIFALNYVFNFLLQLVWTITVGGLLYLLKARDTPYFRPSSSSAVGGNSTASWFTKYFGWMYFATLFELWAYGTE